MEKYKTYLHFLSAKIYKDFRRYQMSKLISWDTPAPTESGCTAIIAMCSRIPYILSANLDCLVSSRWDALKIEEFIRKIDYWATLLYEHLPSWFFPERQLRLMVWAWERLEPLPCILCLVNITEQHTNQKVDSWLTKW